MYLSYTLFYIKVIVAVDQRQKVRAGSKICVYVYISVDCYRFGVYTQVYKYTQLLRFVYIVLLFFLKSTFSKIYTKCVYIYTLNSVGVYAKTLSVDAPYTHIHEYTRF